MGRYKANDKCCNGVVMVDKERILIRLVDIERYAKVLGDITPNSYEAYAKSNVITKAAVERYLQLISDLEIEVLTLVYRGLDLGIAGSEESLTDKFKKLLSKRTIEEFKKRRALRNMLVHAYFDMHYDKDVFEQASNHKDIVDFVNEIRAILKKINN